MTEVAGLVLIYTTLGERADAERIGATLVERGLAACANIVPGMVSIYRWQGAIARDEEVVMLLKTPPGRAAALREALAALHPYETPAILTLAVDAVNEGYAAWAAAAAAGPT